MIGARKGGYRRSPGGGSMNKKKSIWGGGGSFPYGGIFMWAVFSLHVRGSHAIFSVCGGVSFSAWGGGGIIGLAPHNNFCWSLLSQKSFQIVHGGFNFFGGSYSIHQKNLPPPPRPSTNLNK